MPNKRSMRFRSPSTTSLVVVGVVVAVVITIIVSIFYFNSRESLESCTVDSKDRAISVSSDKDGNTTTKTDYRVYTSCGVFTVGDNLFFGRFNSADTYGSLHEGSTYDLDVIGWRNGFFSMFPNILTVEATR